MNTKKQSNSNQAAERASDCSERQRRADGDREALAVPSNTASDNCNPDSREVKFLRFGIDSLYLSYPGQLHFEVNERLKELKTQAQSEKIELQLLAQYVVDDHIFEVKDKGSSFFNYVLEDNAFRIQLSRPSKSVPMAYVKLSSNYLTHKSPQDAEKALSAVLSKLGHLDQAPNVSRIDLFVDFVSSVEMDSWNRDAWVTRANAIDNYSRDQVFTGWAIGVGGNLIARLYNKTEEIKKSGKTYLYQLWMDQGWDGVSPVWRLEFEFKREVLSQFRLDSLDKVMGQLNGLWSYVTTEWLKLTIPNPDDQTRSRWPIHPLWGNLSSVDWETNGGGLLREFSLQRVPSDQYLFGRLQSLLVSYMAKEGILGFAKGRESFYQAFYDYFDGWCYRNGVYPDDFIEQRVRKKAREFNTIFNTPDADAEWEALLQKADEYRRQSDGE